ncbi:MAG: hypothetical protein ACLTHX_10710 [Blautia massiliensis (ex Durand et al. 2017)]|uniref:hypothetical protein n=1 Tax=Blautia massiliensis (ex Durand et al. 2017) TaxID=1737424 RepID=UPI003995C4CB
MKKLQSCTGKADMFVERSRNKSIDKRAYCATLKARIIYSQYGPADFQEGKTHHNWYLFEDKIDSAKMIK